jgi:hypothetical protein
MSSLVLTNGLRYLLLLLAQVLVLKRLSPGIESFNYIHIILYPLFIILLPLKTPQVLVLGLSFLMGLSVDAFYDSPGVHAAASVFTGYLRSFVLLQLEPRGGYNVNFSPTKAKMGFRWFAIYSAILMAGHLFFYFSVEAFTFAHFTDTLLKTCFSFIVSMAFVFAVMLVLDPES